MIDFKDLEEGNVYVSATLGGSKRSVLYVFLDDGPDKSDFDDSYEAVSTWLTISTDKRTCEYTEGELIQSSDNHNFIRKANFQETAWFTECANHGGYLDNPDLKIKLLSEFSYLLAGYLKTY